MEEFKQPKQEQTELDFRSDEDIKKDLRIRSKEAIQAGISHNAFVESLTDKEKKVLSEIYAEDRDGDQPGY